jgi:hypothetical protein
MTSRSLRATSRTVVGELWGRPERDVVFALPAGRYLAQRTTGAGSAGMAFSLAPSEARTLRADEFRAVPEEQLATKGGTVVLWPNEIGVELSAGASLGLGLGAEADVIWQTLDRADSARVAAAGYPTIQRYVGLAPGPIALAHIREPIGLRTWVELAARGGVLLPELSGGLGEMWTWRAEAGVGVQF